MEIFWKQSAVTAILIKMEGKRYLIQSCAKYNTLRYEHAQKSSVYIE